jgi:hypothetical protein
MDNLNHLISSLSALGKEFHKASLEKSPGENEVQAEGSVLEQAIESGYLHNPWFIPAFIRNSFSAWADALEEKKVREWIMKYRHIPGQIQKPLTIGLIMAGNIPMVGLHDLLCVYASGHHAIIRLSSNDNVLIPAMLEVLAASDPGIKDRLRIVEGPLKNFDAVIATGSNNASRYFEYYFSKYPYIIRKNRNGAAVITGSETEEDLQKLADDIFMYYGLGCRSVSKVYIPEGYMTERLFPHFSKYEFLSDLHKYRNNYDYQKSILLINRVHHLDNGFLLVKPDTSLVSPVSVLNTGIYESFDSLKAELDLYKDQIQCVVSGSKELENTVPYGKSQFPELWDYADGVDTMEFLLNLEKT